MHSNTLKFGIESILHSPNDPFLNSRPYGTLQYEDYPGAAGGKGNHIVPSWGPHLFVSEKASSRLRTRSSLANLLLGPHRALTASNLAISASFFSLLASQHIRTNSELQLNFLASFVRVHCSGSELYNRLISSTSASLRWCLCTNGFGLLTGGGSLDPNGLRPIVVAEVKGVEVSSWRRLSSLGRKRKGVWRTEGADEGGLKII